MNAYSRQPKLSLVSDLPSETPTKFSAADYLQLGHASRRSMRVELGNGYIEMVDGVLFRAIDSRGEGVRALMRMLVGGGLTGDTPARCFEGEAIGRQNLDISLENALLEAARQLDESRRRPADPRPRKQRERPLAHIISPNDAIELGLTAVLSKDYRAAYQAFCRARELGDRSALVRGNLDRLAELMAAQP